MHGGDWSTLVIYWLLVRAAVSVKCMHMLVKLALDGEILINYYDLGHVFLIA
jgi:hypothetical protein